MANVMITQLADAILPIDPNNTFFEVQTIEGGIDVSRRIAAVDLGIGTGFAQISPTPVNNQVAVWISADTLEGDANFLWDGAAQELQVTGDVRVQAGNVLITQEATAIWQTGTMEDSSGWTRVTSSDVGNANMFGRYYYNIGDIGVYDILQPGMPNPPNAATAIPLCTFSCWNDADFNLAFFGFQGSADLIISSDIIDGPVQLWSSLDAVNYDEFMDHTPGVSTINRINNVDMLTLTTEFARLDQGLLEFVERAAQGTVTAGRGQLWVRNDTPNVLVFTDDTGTDMVLASGASLPAPVAAFSTLRVNAGATAWEETTGLQVAATQVIVEAINLRVRSGGVFAVNTDDNAATALSIDGPPTTGGATTIDITGEVNIAPAGTLRLNPDTGFDVLLQEGGVTRVQLDNTNARFVLNDYTFFMEERASALADVAAYGQLWVRDTVPNDLYFTDDAGNDFPVGYARGRQNANASFDFNTANNVAHNRILFYDDGANYTVTTEDSGSTTNWEVGTAIQVLAPTAGTITIAEGTGTTLFEADGTDTGAGGSLTGGVVTIYRASATDYYIWGSGFTP